MDQEGYNFPCSNTNIGGLKGLSPLVSLKSELYKGGRFGRKFIFVFLSFPFLPKQIRDTSPSISSPSCPFPPSLPLPSKFLCKNSANKTVQGRLQRRERLIQLDQGILFAQESVKDKELADEHGFPRVSISYSLVNNNQFRNGQTSQPISSIGHSDYCNNWFSRISTKASYRSQIHNIFDVSQLKQFQAKDLAYP